MAELDFIDFIADHQPSVLPPDLQLAIGDDCAVVQKNDGTSLLYTMDSLVENVHFDLDFHSPYLLGRKSLAVNISDIAGMGGVPRFALLSMCLPKSFAKVQQQDFMAGFFKMCDEFAVTLIGGDTVSGESLNITVTLIGEAKSATVCTRAGATVADEIWVSGNLGESSVGLGLLQADKAKAYPELVTAHLDPSPQVALGRLLADSGLVTSLMDISDGVATDLAHICKRSNCGAIIYGSQVPLSAKMKKGALALGRNPLELALSGGEDYQLLFSVQAGQGVRLAELVYAKLGLVITRIGEIDDATGVRLMAEGTISEIGFKGYEHK